MRGGARHVTHVPDAGIERDFMAADVDPHGCGGVDRHGHGRHDERAALADIDHAGDFHKLITLDSPHFGARSDSYVVSIREETIVGRLFAAAMYEAGMPINDGAVDDLEFFSQAIEAIGPANVPSHALAGVGGSDYQNFCPGLSGIFIKTIAFFSDDTVPELLTRIYGNEPNDVVVGLDSQNGPLPSEATSTPIPGPDHQRFTLSICVPVFVSCGKTRSGSP